jgi:uncharacterized membrane protein
MRRDSRTTFLNAAALGAVAGMRATLPLALLGTSLEVLGSRLRSRLGRRRRWLSASRIRTPLLVAAASELIYDKLPFAASRLALPSLAVRLVSGTTAGALVSAALGGPKLFGALTGAVAALGSALLFHRLRARAGRTRLAGALGGVAEDAVALGLTSAVRRSLSA